MDVETGAYKLLAVIIVGVAIVVSLGISYTNLNNNNKQLITSLNATGTCQTTNSLAANYCTKTGIYQNATTNSGNVANTAGVNGNYAYYILFMALILGVIIGALVVKRSRQ